MDFSALEHSITRLVQGHEKNARDFRDASLELSASYRSLDFHNALGPEGRIYGYILTRMPATTGVIAAVLESIPPDIQSLTDLGSGPGSVMWAAQKAFPGLQTIHLVEQNSRMMEMAHLLVRDVPAFANMDIHQHVCNMLAGSSFPEADMVTLAWSLGEVGADKRKELLERAWKAAGKYLVVIEPGTPRGYSTIMETRTFLLENGAQTLAPCPHDGKCPLKKNDDWCHFSRRIVRHRFHRDAKGAVLPYEDEKYSYIVMAKNPIAREEGISRVVRMPLLRSGHVHLDLCGSNGLKRNTITKREKKRYSMARHIRWGDAWKDTKNSDPV